MGYPKNPETVVLTNKYYPQGIKEINLWDYYQSVEPFLLKQTRGRDLFVYLVLPGEKFLILRKGKTTRFIRLTASNYDQVITGRTISIHSTMRRDEDIGIIDVDCDDFKKAKLATLDTYEYVIDSIPFIKTAYIRYTGKSGFHIVCNLDNKINIDTVKFLLQKSLLNSPLVQKYTIESKRVRGIPNLDLAPNKYRGGFITLGSLSIMGLKCMEVRPTDIMRFTPHLARIKL